MIIIIFGCLFGKFFVLYIFVIIIEIGVIVNKIIEFRLILMGFIFFVIMGIILILLISFVVIGILLGLSGFVVGVVLIGCCC